MHIGGHRLAVLCHGPVHSYFRHRAWQQGMLGCRPEKCSHARDGYAEAGEYGICDNLRLQVREVLAHIEAGALLPPLVVLQTLAKNPQLKLAVVKDYAARTLSAEGAMVEEDRKTIARFQEETASMRAEITELKTKVCHI